MSFRLFSAVLPVLISLLFSPVAVAKPPELTLANVYQMGMPLDGYWVSEKLDGVRAYWTGERFLSRGGHEYRAPGWFTRGFPAHPLDGELWMGRGRFAELSGAVRQVVPDDDDWRRIRFMVFDLPDQKATFDQRLVRLKALIEKVGSPHMALVDQQRASSHEDLMLRLDKVVAGGGEGLMLRLGASGYRSGRSNDLLKVKRYQDAEAVVVHHLPGKGKYEGLMGSLLVELEDGRQFRIGSGFSDSERASPPKPGTTITFKYYGLTATGLPRFASFLRIRNDEPAR
ncbi:DNA ligase [Marinobacter sp. EhC06]|jgi:DNA ligase-1|uniref:DNA ligase n=1 Tax=Marinobacter TaxID=2742 RepID=UPI0007D8D81B|nr:MULTISPECIES: DNA ligase [unclassified Marinobacter]OAN88623.1 DNA ligase [Marinobacter sp. EhN04]OAN91605.1 DNA ligase [Marinobacter sp. EhC06]